MKNIIISLLIVFCAISCKKGTQDKYESIRKSFFSNYNDFTNYSEDYIILPIKYLNHEFLVCTSTQSLYDNLGIDIIGFDKFWPIIYKRYQDDGYLSVNEAVYEKFKAYSRVEEISSLKLIYDKSGIDGVLKNFMKIQNINIYQLHYFVYLCWENDIFVHGFSESYIDSRIELTLSGNLPEKYGSKITVLQDLVESDKDRTNE